MVNTIAAIKEKRIRVAVPRWSGDYNGFLKVDRGTMSDEEWKTWLSISKGEIARQINLFMKAKRPATELQSHIVKFLTSKEVNAWAA